MSEKNCDFLYHKYNQEVQQIENKSKCDYRKRILVNRISGLGDVLMLTAFCKHLKEIFNPCHITFRTNQSVVIENNRYIDQIIPAKGNDFKYVKDINVDYDLVYNFDYCVESYLVGPAGKIDEETYMNVPRMKLFFQWAGMKVPKNLEMSYNLNKEAHLKSVGFHQNLKGKKHIVYCLRTQVPVREYPILSAIQLFEKILELGFGLILVASPFDLEKTDLFNKTFNEWITNCQCDRLLNLTGKLNFREFAAIIAESDIVITPDSGGLHVAEALRVHHIDLFGNIDPKLRIITYKFAHPLFKKAECLCGDRFPIKMKICPAYSVTDETFVTISQRGSYCMSQITPDEIIEAVHKVSKILDKSN